MTTDIAGVLLESDYGERTGQGQILSGLGAVEYLYQEYIIMHRLKRVSCFLLIGFVIAGLSACSDDAAAITDASTSSVSSSGDSLSSSVAVSSSVATSSSAVISSSAVASSSAGPAALAFTGLTANGTSGTATTTELTLTFDVEPIGLAASNITLTGATKGALTGSGTTRSLAISSISVANGATVSVAVASPAGFVISGSPRTAAVFKAPTAVAFSALTANGVAGAASTTTVTLTFDVDPITLAESDIMVTGATKGVLSGTGTTRTLAISSITIANGDSITVALANPAGFAITPASRTVAVTVVIALSPVMLSVPAKTDGLVFGLAAQGNVRTVPSISAFRIGKYEVTYTLWTNVTAWAVNNGYTFAHAGTMSSGTEVPVTSINYRDMLAWCNALSERSLLVPAYYTTTAKTVVYRNAYDSSSALLTGGNDCVNWTASGYRLPTSVEWEYAARRRTDGTLADAEKVSGYYGSTPFDGATVLADWGPYVWYSGNAGGSAHAVGTTLANELGACDMSGNVQEMVWDFYGVVSDASPYTDADTRGPTSGSYRLGRGGCYVEGAWSVEIWMGWYSTSISSASAGYYLGFRLASGAP